MLLRKQLRKARHWAEGSYDQNALVTLFQWMFFKKPEILELAGQVERIHRSLQLLLSIAKLETIEIRLKEGNFSTTDRKEM